MAGQCVRREKENPPAAPEGDCRPLHRKGRRFHYRQFAVLRGTGDFRPGSLPAVSSTVNFATSAHPVYRSCAVSI
jgi:hypothetical protein